MREKSAPKRAKRDRTKKDWSTSTRPHQVQDPGALVERSQQAKRKRNEEGATHQDQSP